jgi:ATP-binding cassette subfamily B multidrug efflux pump
MARMTNDLNAVRNLLGPALMYSANTVFFSVFALYFLLHLSPWLTFVALAPMPLASILVQYLGHRIHDRFERIQASFSEISSQAQENYSGARLVRAFAREESQIGIFEKLNRLYIARSLRLVQLMGMLWPTLEFILGVSMVITLYVGGHQVIAGRITPGDFVEFNTFMIMLIWPIIAVGWVVNLFQRGTASVIRIDELLQAKPSIDDSAADSSVPADLVLAGEIEFRNLNFSYGDTPVLRDIKLKVPAGSSLAIVGPTGSGKSTLVSLLSRIHEAPPDTLLIDGRSVRDYPLAVLRRNIGVVPQETFLFSETIRENLRFGVPDASEEELLNAAEAAHIRQEFAEFPEGLETMVGERGLTLSGGQKQRAAIARALLRRPAILILDDALASVDTYTEERILGGLRSYTCHIDHDPDLTSCFHGARCRPDRRACSRPHRRDRQTRGPFGPRRLLRQPLSEAAARGRTHRCGLGLPLGLRVRHSNANRRPCRRPRRSRRNLLTWLLARMRATCRGAGFTFGSRATSRQASRTFLTHSIACSNFGREADCEACKIWANIDA